MLRRLGVFPIGPSVILSLVATVASGQSLTKPVNPELLDENKPRERRTNTLPVGAALHAKFIEATGGRAAYEAHENCVIDAEFELPEGNFKGTVRMVQAVGQRFAIETFLPDGSKLTQASDGKLVWEVRPDGELYLYPPTIAATIIRANDFRHELSVPELYPMIECTGVEEVESKPAYKVLMMSSEGTTMTRYYDKDSSLLVKQVLTVPDQRGVQAKQATLIGDYRVVEGVKVSFTSKQASNDQVQQTLTIQSIKFNEKLDPKLFTPPAKITELLKRAEETKDAQGKDGGVLPAQPAAPSLDRPAALPASPVAPPKR